MKPKTNLILSIHTRTVYTNQNEQILDKRLIDVRLGLTIRNTLEFMVEFHIDLYNKIL